VAGLEIAAVADAERERAVATLVSAFEADPVERWLYPGEDEYRAHFPAFVTAFGGAAFRDGTVWRMGDFEATSFDGSNRIWMAGEYANQFQGVNTPPVFGRNWGTWIGAIAAS